jgi:hypothetical protein
MKTTLFLVLIFVMSFFSGCKLENIMSGCGDDVDITQKYFEFSDIKYAKHYIKTNNGSERAVSENEEIRFYNEYKGCRIEFDYRLLSCESGNNNGLLYACSPIEPPKRLSKAGFKSIKVLAIDNWMERLEGQDISDLMSFNNESYTTFMNKNAAKTDVFMLNIRPIAFPAQHSFTEKFTLKFKVIVELTDGRHYEVISPVANFIK